MDVAVTQSGYSASGTATFELNYAPMVGTQLRVVNNLGLGFISGAFSNLSQGQTVALTHGGTTYYFAANYFGGTGNDLVLVWKNSLPCTWPSGSFFAGVIITAPVALNNTGVLAGKTVVALDAGNAHNVALCSDGTVVSWGENQHGQLGNNTRIASGQPVAIDHSGVLAGKTVVSVAVGQAHSLALCSDGTLATWGLTRFTQQGSSGESDSPVPIRVDDTGVLAGKTVVAIAAGGAHNLALCSDGTLVAWGINWEGQLGNSGTSHSDVPVEVVRSGVLSGKTPLAVAAGADHSLALCSDGSVAAWGSNSHGQLGNNSTVPSTVPVLVINTGVLAGKSVVALDGGYRYSLARCSDGTLAGWGRNEQGQLGDGTILQRESPVAVGLTGALSGKSVSAVSAGLSHNLALCSDGTVAAWGLNSSGQLGNTNSSQSNVPVAVLSAGWLVGRRVVAVSAGALHSLALAAAPPSGEINVTSDYAPIEDVDFTAPFRLPYYTDFGQTPERLGSVSRSFTIHNADPDMALNLLGSPSVAVGGPNAADFTVTAQPSSPMAPNGSTTFHVTFDPGGIGSRDAILRIDSDDLDENPFEFSVTGFGSAPAISLVGNRMGIPDGDVAPSFADHSDFGNVLLAEGTCVRTFLIQNKGVGRLNLTGAPMVTVHGVNAADFTVTMSPSSPVEASRQTLFHVTFAPGALGLRTASLRVACDDPVHPSFEFAVQGTGIPVVNAAYSTGGEIPASASHLGTTNLVNFSLNYAPSPGTELMVVENSGIGFLTGKLGNLGQGQTVGLRYNGTTYSFVANYFGGTGNDLTLTWQCSRVFGWGLNGDGQLGDGSMVQRSTPVAVTFTGALAGKTVVKVAAGLYHSVALCSDGTVASWGDNAYGQLGVASPWRSNAPVEVNRTGILAGKTVVSVAAGQEHSLALCSDGTVSSWGNLWWTSSWPPPTGYPLPYYTFAPALVSSTGELAGNPMVAVAAGGSHNLALRADGTVFAWGSNYLRQLGGYRGSLSGSPEKVEYTGVLEGRTVVAVAAGESHSLALVSDGTVVAWGDNGYGQLGVDRYDQSGAPEAVNRAGALRNKTVVAIAAGGRHSLALCSDGTIAGWGGNFSGQLGDVGSSNRYAPVAVPGTGALEGKTVVSVAAGWAHSLALCSDGTLATWGGNANAQLGNGSTSDSREPVAVSRSSIAPVDRFSGLPSCSMASHSLALVAISPPSTLTYATNPAAYTVGMAISLNTPSVKGTVDAYTVSPALPPGLMLDPVTGVISGTPEMALGPTTNTVTATNGAGSTSHDVNVTIHSRIQAWRQTHFGSTANLGNAADDADADGDGESNLFEFVAGLHPLDAESHFSVRADAVPDQPNRTAIRIRPIVPGRVYTVKCKADLASPIWTDLGGFSVIDNGNERTVIDVDAAGERKYYRVEIALP